MDFNGGKVDADVRRAKAGVLAQVRGQAVGLNPGNFDVVFVPAGTFVPSGELVAKFCVEEPPAGLVNNVITTVHVSHANPTPKAEKEA